MPNHCYQSVEIRGPRNLVQYIYHQLTQHGRFCDAVIPLPIEHAVKSYDWCWDNWGTKWDVMDIQVTNGVNDLGVERDGDEWFSFQCWTAWGPPIPVWERLVALGLEVDADYEDEGMMFAGYWANGENSSWDPEPEYEEEEA